MAVQRKGLTEGRWTPDQKKLAMVTALKHELAGYELYGKDEAAAQVRKELAKLVGKEKAVPSKAPETTAE